MYRKPTAPQSIGQMLDGAFKLFRASWSRAWWFGLAGSLISSAGDFLSLLTGNPQPPGSVTLPGLFAIMLSLVLYSACYLRQEAIAKGEDSDWEFSDALPYAPRLLLMYIVLFLILLIASVPLGFFVASATSGNMSGVAMTMGIALLAILPLTALVYLIFGNLLMIVEDRSTFEALNASRKLVSGFWWRTAAVLLVGLLIVSAGLALIIAAVMAAGPLLGWVDDAGAALIGMIAEVLWQGLLAVPFLTALMMSLYYDLKLRKEGTDLEARIAADQTADSNQALPNA